jgi:hypothetical protein
MISRCGGLTATWLRFAKTLNIAHYAIRVNRSRRPSNRSRKDYAIPTEPFLMTLLRNLAAEVPFVSPLREGLPRA